MPGRGERKQIALSVRSYRRANGPTTRKGGNGRVPAEKKGDVRRHGDGGSRISGMRLRPGKKIREWIDAGASV